MQEDPIHGVLGTKVKQTYCGLAVVEGLKYTDNPFSATCPDCVRLMRIAGILPDLDRPHTRGRPRQPRRSHEES